MLILVALAVSLGLITMGLVLSLRKQPTLFLVLTLVMGLGLVVSIMVPVLRAASGRPLASPPAPPTSRTIINQVELAAAQAKGLVEVTAAGNDLAYLKLTLKSRSADPLEVVIPAGSLFEATSRSVQNMVVRTEQRIELAAAEQEVSLLIPVACANMERETPGGGDRFTLSRTSPGNDLMKLLRLADFQNQSFETQQFAIWTITNNPGPYEYVGIGTFGAGSGPGDEDLRHIRSLFKQAGIDPGKYRAIRE